MKIILPLLSKKIAFHFCLALFLFLGISSYSQTNFYTGALDQTAWDNLLSEVDTNRATLESKIADAEAENPPLETSYAKVSLYTIDEFRIYAIYDRNNAVALQAIYEGQGFAGFNNDFEDQIQIERGSQVAFSLFHPYQQLYDCTKILNKAISTIDEQIAGSIILPETPDFSTPGYPTLQNNSNHYQKDGNIIFPSSQWGLSADSSTLSDRKSNQMETLGYLGSLFHISSQVENNGGKLETKSNYTNGQRTQLTNQLGNNQSPTQVHFTHRGVSNTAWTDLYPDIDDFKQIFIHYDIDYPNLKEINRGVIETFVEPIANAANGSSLVYVLSNEPRFDISQGLASQGVSNYTYSAYIDHLKIEYGNDINTLNTVYNPHNGNQNFANFDALKNAYTIPLNRNIWQGTPIWYDWLRFNMNRVNKWISDLKDLTLESDPNAKISVKILGRSVEDPIKDDGIDPEGLMDLQNFIGFDNQVVPNETHGRNNRFYKEYIDHYIMDWREQAIMMDFAKSLYPNKPTFDSEWHAISSNAWDNFALDEGYTRSALWMAYTNGLSMMNSWWWYRNDNGSLQGKVGTTGNIMFSPQHQAIVYDEFGRTMKELNALGNTVATLIPAERDFLIYYSMEAAIQDWNYSIHMANIYEALKLMNVKVGFTTENKINNLNYTPKAIIFPPTLFIKDSSIDALNTFTNDNPSVSVIDIKRGGNPNFENDEKGTPDGSRVKTFLNGATGFNFTTDIFGENGTGLIERLRSRISAPTHPIDFQITDPGTGSEGFGVFALFGSTPENKHAMALINLSLEDREIVLPSSPNGYSNMLTGKLVNTTFTMNPYDVLLINNGVTLSNRSLKDRPKTYNVYPNPATDIFTVKNKFLGNYALYSVSGALIRTFESKSEILEIPVNNLSTGLYFLEIPTAEGKKVERIVVDRK